MSIEQKRKYLDQIGELHTQMKTLVDAAEAKGGMTTEDLDAHGKLFDQISLKQKNISAIDQQTELDRQLAAATDKTTKTGSGSNEPTVMDGFKGALMYGKNYNGPGKELYNALQQDSDTQGGFVATPQQFVNQLIQFVDDALWIRQRATVITLTQGDSIGIPALTVDPSDADWTAEIVPVSEDSQMSFGKRQMKVHPLAKRLRISNKLLRNSAIPIEKLIAERLAFKFAVPQEKAFMLGSGNGQPLGLFTPSDQGISVNRDVSTGNTTSNISFDGLIEAKYGLKSQYQAKAEWLMHRLAVKQVSKLKDSDGQYLWQPSTQQGQPSLILGNPLNMSEYVPNSFTAGAYVGMIGDFSQYWILDTLNFQMQMLHELYAESNQVGFIGRSEVDGMPVLEEAFNRIQLASS